MKKTEYQIVVDGLLKPTLTELGFEEVNLKNCISEEVLFRKGRLWFGTSWDYRDRYMEMSLGHLFWFKDVMPRVIVIGNYTSYVSEVGKLVESDNDYLKKVVNTVSRTIGKAVTVYEKKYEHILSGHINKRSKYSGVFLEHLGEEVKYEELSEFKT